eukprot:2598123-Prorocentrum_lima.AAC.1
MTSSLVGSEMCIRDRRKSANATSIAVNFFRSLGPSMDLWNRPATVSPQTVSYTHLTLPTICSV